MTYISIVREPATPPTILPRPDSRPLNREILFRHPGYSDSNNIMLKLLAPDMHNELYGLYAQFALDACGVIAGNRWDGWLSRFRDPVSVKEDATGILQEASYYFHLPESDSDEPYPVVPNFTQWRFPHNNGSHLPDAWRQLNLEHSYAQYFTRSDFSAAVRSRDLSCRITGCRVATQVAHLCPQKEYDWIDQNVMHQYNQLGEPGPNDPSNMLLLRADLHLEFDSKKFVFVPKYLSKPQQHHTQLVTHVLKPEAELEHLYHNRKLQFSQNGGPSVEWLFTRFAWSIFPFLNCFLTTKVPRHLRLYNENGEPIDSYFPVNACVEFSSAPNAAKSRSQSPKKRQRAPAPGDDAPGIESGDYEHDLRPSKRFRLCQELSSDLPRRGREKYRHLAAQHPPFNTKQQPVSWVSQSSDQILRESAFNRMPTPAPRDQDPSESLRHDRLVLCSSPSPSGSTRTLPTLNDDHYADTKDLPPLQIPAANLDNFDHLAHLDDYPHTDEGTPASQPALAEAWLLKNRARVDPAQLKHWEEEQRWAKEVWNGKTTLNEESARKWYEIIGVEVID